VCGGFVWWSRFWRGLLLRDSVSSHLGRRSGNVAVVFDVGLPEAVWVSSLPAFEASLSAWLVGFVDQFVLFEDGVDASVPDLDAAGLQVGFDGFTAPAVCSSDL